jgi:hypothetical protein
VSGKIDRETIEYANYTQVRIEILERALRWIIHEAVIQGALRCPPKMFAKNCSEYTEKTDCWYDYILAKAKEGE